MADRNRYLSAAIHYAELGYPVFPCVPGTKKPLTEHGFKDATTDPAQIEAWWTQWPDANVGIATADLAVIDIDGASNAWLADDPEKAESLACGPMSLTPRGGRHHVFRQPAGRSWGSSSGKLAPKVDVRANGGYIVAPPSVTEDGAYAWAETFELDVPPDRLPEPPAWLAALLDDLERPQPVASTAGNPIPSGQRNVAVARLAGAMRRVGMTEAELLAAIERVNADRCQPPLPASEIRHIATSVARYPPDQISVALAEDHFGQDFARSPAAAYLAVAQLLEDYKTMCKPIIHGLLREGEIMNVIAAPKTGKSWLVLDLALSVVSGRAWLDFPTEKGRVLLLDNELHPQTLANRIPRVAEAMGLSPGPWGHDFCVKTLRGQLQDLFKMEDYFKALPPGHFKLIILDAFYRFMPRDMDENDNGTMANLYNLLDRWAARLEAAFVLIHHTTKGLQSEKGVTDVGAGAGSQSRAADCHFILRPHEQDGCLSVDAVARSWPSPPSFVLRQQFPLWVPDHTLDPKSLKKPNRKQPKPSPEGAPDEPLPDWTPEQFVEAFLAPEPRSRPAILLAANEHDLSDYRAGKFLERAEAKGLVHRWALDHNRIGYATEPQPELDLQGDAEDEPSKREAVAGLLAQSPDLSNREAADQCGVSLRYVQRIRRELTANKEANNEG